MNYTAPEMEIISIETQNCFASSVPTSCGISSDYELSDLGIASTDWD